MSRDWRDLIAVAELEENWVTRVDLGPRKLAVYDTPSGVHVSLALCNHCLLYTSPSPRD